MIAIEQVADTDNHAGLIGGAEIPADRIAEPAMQPDAIRHQPKAAVNTIITCGREFTISALFCDFAAYFRIQ